MPRIIPPKSLRSGANPSLNGSHHEVHDVLIPSTTTQRVSIWGVTSQKNFGSISNATNIINVLNPSTKSADYARIHTCGSRKAFSDNNVGSQCIHMGSKGPASMIYRCHFVCNAVAMYMASSMLQLFGTKQRPEYW